MEPVVAVYREFAPHAALKPYIRAVFSFVPGAGQDQLPRQQLGETLAFGRDFTCPPILADGHVCLSFNLGEVCHADGRWRVDPAGCRGRIVGAVTRADASGVERPSMVGAYFHAAGLPAFASVAVHELTDGIATAEDIWGPAAADMAARLAHVNEAARIDALETLLIERLGEQRRSHATVDVPGLAASIAQSGGRVAVEQLAFEAGVSRQHLTRLFRERVGVTPKLYARLARFQSGLACAGSIAAADRAQVALELGYADQSHWIAEFKEFSGLTPQQFAARRWLHPFVERALHGHARTRSARSRAS